MPIETADAVWSWLLIPVLLVPTLIVFAGVIALLFKLWARFRGKRAHSWPARRASDAERDKERQRELARELERESRD